MTVGAWIILGFVILLVAFIYFIYMMLYIGAALNYRKANKCDAMIEEYIGDMKFAVGGVPGRTIRRKFPKYKVTLEIDGIENSQEIQIKNRKLKPGDHIDVRYTLDKQNNVKIAQEAFLCWLRQMFWGYTGGLIFGLLLLVLKLNDII